MAAEMRLVSYSSVVPEVLKLLGEAKRKVERTPPFFDGCFSPSRHEAQILATHLKGLKSL